MFVVVSGWSQLSRTQEIFYVTNILFLWIGTYLEFIILLCICNDELNYLTKTQLHSLSLLYEKLLICCISSVSFCYFV